jgi:crotonobetainyl-CoA:carnitine CoA-transferase CaiB-like acyl-CoA transferase
MIGGNFLVSPQMGAYFCHFDEGVPVCTLIPSMAEHFRYATADRLAQHLRSHGFPEAHVADLSGMPATPQSIADAQVESTDVEDELKSLPGIAPSPESLKFTKDLAGAEGVAPRK